MIQITEYNKNLASILTLGCKVNQYESEVIKEKLENQGYIFTDFKAGCDLYIIHTCAVTNESSRKSCQMIRRAVKMNPNAVIAVLGCQSQLAADMIADIDGVDIVCGNYNKLLIVDAILNFSGKPVIIQQTFQSDDNFEPMEIERFGRTRAYIKIQDGCNSNCAYCIIPKVRGDIRMKPADDVIREACRLVRNGCKEIVLIGIETSSYKNLTRLVGELQKIDGLERIRLGSLDPSFMRPNVTDELMAHSKFTPHFHLSMQSGSDKILRLMRRKYNTETALRNIEYIKSVNSEVNFTTDIMTGFPGESETEFNETVEFAKIVEFLHIHIFTYSIRPGTDAAVMPDQVPEPEKIRRAAVLAEIQENIKRSIYEKVNTNPLSVLVETYENNTLFGHTPNFLEVEAISSTDLRDKIITVNPIGINEPGNKLIGEII